MLILGIDSSSSACSACIWRDGKVLSEMTEQMERGQDQRLMPLILEVMQKAGIEFKQLDRIAVTRGPGSFTGIRIGLAAARGIGLASNKPVIGIDRFEIFREQNKTDKNLLVVIESRRQELFCKFYPANGKAGEVEMWTQEQITGFLKQHPDTIVIGDREKISGREVVTCALIASRVDANDAQHLPRPLYIRPPDVTMPKTAAPADQCT